MANFEMAKNIHLQIFFFAISNFAIIDDITSAQLAAFWFFSFIHLKSNVLDYSL